MRIVFACDNCLEKEFYELKSTNGEKLDKFKCKCCGEVSYIDELKILYIYKTNKWAEN